MTYLVLNFKSINTPIFHNSVVVCSLQNLSSTPFPENIDSWYQYMYPMSVSLCISK